MKSATMTLYYAPGVCSLSPHIALIEAGLDFVLDKVDFRQKRTASGEDFFAINNKGNVPALRLIEGGVLTEGAAIVQWIADLAPDSQLAPANGTLARARLQEMLNFISSELHKGFCPLMNPQADVSSKQMARNNLENKWAWLNKFLGEKPYLLGEYFTVADTYLFNVLYWWVSTLRYSLDSYSALATYYLRVLDRPSVQKAMHAEGLR